ncbi:MAG: hypothetical protein NWQ54_23750 [Paraglaciecola sp.]|nr:hypothetical protein [Paraglaciecola sp.]
MNVTAELLNHFQQFTDDLAQLGLGWVPKTLKPVVVKTQSHRLTREQVQAELITKVNSSGWLLLPSQKIDFPTTAAQITAQNPLEGEGFAENISWQLSYLGDETWLWCEHQVIAALVEQATHLAEDVQHMSTESNSKKLCYLRLWKPSNTVDEQPSLDMAIFIGFSGGKA